MIVMPLFGEARQRFEREVNVGRRNDLMAECPLISAYRVLIR
jgi:hypothetical protein